ncbi:MAG: hypothetical protein R2711_11500 [Acidimicrobiales bacterium]
MQAVEAGRQRRHGVERDLEPLALGPEAPRRVEVVGAHEPVDAHGDHRFAPDGPLPGHALGGHRARVEHADGRVDRTGGDGRLDGGRLVGVERPAERVGDEVDRLAEAVAQQPEHRAGRRLLRRLAEQHDLAHHELRRVGAQVGELLGPDVADVAAEAREEHGDLLGDAARVDAGAVHADPGLPAGALELGDVGGPRREEPAGRRHDVAPGADDAEQLGGARQHRRVEHAVGVDGEHLVDVARGRHPERRDPAELAHVAPGLGRVVDVRPRQLQVGVGDDALDGVATDVAGRPLDHAQAHPAMVPSPSGRAP